MPRYSGALLALAVIVICIGINMTQFPIAREIMADSFALSPSSDASTNVSQEVSSPDIAKEAPCASSDVSIVSVSEPPTDTVIKPGSDSTRNVNVPSTLAIQASQEKEEQKQPIEQNKNTQTVSISQREGSTAPPHGGSPSRISLTSSLVPNLPLASNTNGSNNGYEPIPSGKAKLRGSSQIADSNQNGGQSPLISSPKESISQNKADDEAESEPAFRLSVPNPAYREQVTDNTDTEKTDANMEPAAKPESVASDSGQVKPLPAASNEAANPWSAIHVKIRPYDVVEAFRKSPLSLDIMYTDETHVEIEDPYAGH